MHPIFYGFTPVATMSAQLRVKLAYDSKVRTPATYQAEIASGLQKAARKWSVKLPAKDYDKYVFLGANSRRFGNRCIEDATKLSYERQLQQFWRYLAYKGDYESMLMLLEPCSSNAPSVDVYSAEEFVRFKRYKANEKLDAIKSNQDAEHTNAIKDIFGAPITADGGWNNPKVSLIFRAAIHVLHVENKRNSEYHDVCEECYNLPLVRRHTGCENHAGFPRFCRRGDPTRDHVFLNTIRNMEKRSKAEKYRERGSSQLLPSDLRLLRNNLLSSKSIVKLQFWVITIVSVQLFLRHDEFHDIQMDHFCPSLFSIMNGRIDALALEVFGKSDDTWQKQLLHANHIYPELCPVRPLLIYMHLIQIQGGSLFPSASELMDPPEDRVYKTTIDYGTFLQQLKEICSDVLPERSDLKIGAHTFRKTGYVIAVFGDATDANLQLSARHKSVEASNKYRKDAATAYAIHKESPNPANNCSKWKESHVHDDGGNVQLMNAYGGTKYVETRLIADYFVKEILMVDPKSPLTKDGPIHLIGLSLKYVGSIAPGEQFKALLHELPSDKQCQFQKVVDAMLCERLRGLLSNQQLAHALVAMPQPNWATDASTSEDGSPTPAKKRTKIDANDLAERHELKSLKENDKLSVMKKLWDDRDNWEKPLTSGAKTFYVKFLTPVMKCLYNHFEGDVENFNKKHPKWLHTSFVSTCCSGDGNTCSPKN